MPGPADKVAERRRQKGGPTAGPTATGSTPRHAQKIRIDKLLDKLPFGPKRGSGGRAGGSKGGSRFRFPGVKQQDSGASSSGGAQKGGKQPAVVASSSLPRNKQPQNNKKNKARRAEKREEREKKREDIATGASSGTPGGPGTLPVTTDGKGNKVIQLNNVPKDEEILGGADGKTFTTHSRFKTSEMYARIRDERGV